MTAVPGSKTLKGLEDIPTDPNERVVWLYEWWERIDDWIEERRDPAHPSEPRLAPGELVVATD